MRKPKATARYLKTLKTLPVRSHHVRTIGPTTRFRRVRAANIAGDPRFLTEGAGWRRSLRGPAQKMQAESSSSTTTTTTKKKKKKKRQKRKEAAPLPILLAAYGGGGRKVERVLRQRALIAACHSGDTDTVRSGLADGFSANAADQSGRPLLFVAAWKNCPNVIDALLYAGADVDKTTTKGQTALLVAARHGHTAVVERLLRAGAQPSFVHYSLPSSCTPLYAAAVGGHRTVVARLLAAGADPRPLVHGLSALDAVHDIMRGTVANETLANGVATQLAMERDTVICRALEKALAGAVRNFNLTTSLATAPTWGLKSGAVEPLAPLAPATTSGEVQEKTALRYDEPPLVKAKHFDLDASLGVQPQWCLKTGVIQPLEVMSEAAKEVNALRYDEPALVRAKNFDLMQSLSREAARQLACAVVRLAARLQPSGQLPKPQSDNGWIQRTNVLGVH